MVRGNRLETCLQTELDWTGLDWTELNETERDYT